MSEPTEDTEATDVPEASLPDARKLLIGPIVTPPARGRPGLDWDGSGTLGRLSPHAGMRAAPVPHASNPAEDEASVNLEPDLVLHRGGSVASVGRRAIGFVADQLTLLLLLLLVVSSVGGGAWIPLSLVIPLGYHWVFDSLGWSPGKRVAGLRLVNARGQPPGIIAGGARALVALLIPFSISYVWALWDHRVQTLHDKAARTYVVPLSELTDRERSTRR